MEKDASFVVNAGIRMPIGYRFYPTDEELVLHYLTRKNFNLPLPASVIPEVNVFQTAPWFLPGDVNEKRYFFSSESYSNVNGGSKRKRVASGSGYWKPIGRQRLILASGSNNHPVGVKKTLVFHQRKHSQSQSHGANDTRWLMHQFSLLNSSQLQMNESLGNLSVYRVFQKKIKAKKHGVIRPSFIDFTADECSGYGPPQPSSPSLSETTP